MLLNSVENLNVIMMRRIQGETWKGERSESQVVSLMVFIDVTVRNWGFTLSVRQSIRLFAGTYLIRFTF